MPKLWIDEVKSKKIDILKSIQVGEIQQWVRIRGQNVSNPILLFLHGGPGLAQMTFAHNFQLRLEKYFIVVNWDQRGAGKSYYGNISKESMNFDQYVSDVQQVVNILLHEFNKEKIYLSGLSWGASIGAYSIKEFPELFYAFIPCGFGAEYKESEKNSFDFVLDTANTLNNKKALNELRKFVFPPKPEEFGEFVRIKGKWLMKFGGCIHGSVPKLFIKVLPFLLFSPVYSFKDRLKWLKGLKFSNETAGNLIMGINLFEQIPEIDIPIYFCIGKYDYVTSYKVTEKYYNILKSPLKKIIWFENSAHAPTFEEPDKFADVLINIVLPETYKQLI